MDCTGSSLFHKKSKATLRNIRVIRAEHTPLRPRQSSSASTSSQSSTSSARSFASFDPLSLHPPLAMNSSPLLESDEASTRHQVDREMMERFIHQTDYIDPFTRGSGRDSIAKEVNMAYDARSRRRCYIYDQNGQWPLKDWQTVLPALADTDSEDSEDIETPRPTTRSTPIQKRDTDWMDEPDVYVKRGGWKRRGVIFDLDPKDLEFTQQHFELPE